MSAELKLETVKEPTPGPWEVFVENQRLFDPITGEPEKRPWITTWVQSKEGTKVAVVCHASGCESVNANLLAASREMFEALDRINQLVFDIMNEPSSEIRSKKVALIGNIGMRAHAKARGDVEKLCPTCDRPLNLMELGAGYKYCVDCGGDPSRGET